MKMYSSFRMNNTIDTVNDFISPESYEMVFDKSTICFDFEEQFGRVDRNDTTIVTFEAQNLDIESFPDSAVIDDINVLNTINSLNAFHISVNSDNDSTGNKQLELASIISISFETSNGEHFDVPAAIIDHFNKTRPASAFAYYFSSDYTDEDTEE